MHSKPQLWIEAKDTYCSTAGCSHCFLYEKSILLVREDEWIGSFIEISLKKIVSLIVLSQMKLSHEVIFLP